MKIKKILLFFIVLLIIPLSACSKKTQYTTREKYYIANSYFETVDYKVEKKWVSKESKYNYYLNLTWICDVELDSVSFTIDCYDDDDAFIGTLTLEDYWFNSPAKQRCGINELLEDSKYYNTKKIDVSYYGYSYIRPNTFDKILNVVFVCNNDNKNIEKKVKYGKTVSKPANPTKDNCIFYAWYYDQEFTKEYDFSNSVVNDLTLYAKYIVDYEKLNDRVNDTAAKADVTIVTTSYTGSSSQSIQGSGVIIYENSSYYYILTNYHIVKLRDGYKNRKFTIEDCYGNEYSGSFVAQTSAYDLGLLRIGKKSNIKLNVIEFSDNNPNQNDIVVSISQPMGQRSTVSYGKVIGIGNAPVLSDGTQITGKVIISSAKTANGSSGGAVLDTNLELIGLHYAGTTKQDTGEFVCGFAIPIESIKLFVSNYINL